MGTGVSYPSPPWNVAGRLIAQADVTVPRDFVPFSATHYVTLVGCVGVVVALSALGLRWRGTPAGERLLNGWLAILIVIQLISIPFYALWPRFDWGHSLPLEVCDLGGIIAIFALGWRWRLARTLLYYWGLALTTNAFVTPILHSGPGTLRFWLFWGSHLGISASAIYDLVVNRYRPTWRDFGVVTLGTLLYAAVIIPLDILGGFNYGFAGKDMIDTRTMVDVLGAWPMRLVYMFLLTELLYVVLTVVWRRSPGGRQGETQTR